MKAITPRQVETAAAVLRYTKAHGFPPTYRELQVMLGLRSTNATSDRVKYTRSKGLLVNLGGVSTSRALTARECCCTHPRTWRPVWVPPGTFRQFARAEVSKDAICIDCYGIVLMAEREKKAGKGQG